MISLIKLLLVFSLLPLPLVVAEEEGIVFDGKEWDFGTIQVEDGPVSHAFRFRNTGDLTVMIGDFVPSCTCVQANIADRIIEPGEEGEIQFVFNPRRTRGQTYRTIEVYTSDGEMLVTLGISAECIRKKKI